MTPPVPLTPYLFPEALERGSHGWKSLASFLPSRALWPLWTRGVQRVWEQGEELSQRGSVGVGGALGLLHIVGPLPSPASSLWT